MTANDASKIVDVNEEDETHDLENKISNRTFRNPSQVDKYCSDTLFRCEICDFASARKDTIENHKELIHNWCPQCLSSFTNQNKLKSNIRNIHCGKYLLNQYPNKYAGAEMFWMNI